MVIHGYPVYGFRMFLVDDLLLRDSQCAYFKFRACCLVQVEYYFSDLNWAKDEYLRSLADGDGFVAIENIMDFKLLKQICSDFDTIKESLETSDLQLSPCGNRLRKTNTSQRH